MIKKDSEKGEDVVDDSKDDFYTDPQKRIELLKREDYKCFYCLCELKRDNFLENFKYINLNVLKTYQKLYPDVILGLSDHTPGYTTVLGAIAMGAKVIEKHFTDDNSRIGPDHGFAMNPRTWKEMVDRTRELELSMGDGVKRIEKNEKKTIIVQRRSLRATRDIKSDEIIRKDDFESLRPIPTDGIPPYEVNKLINKKLIRPLKKGEHITWKHIK